MVRFYLQSNLLLADSDSTFSGKKRLFHIHMSNIIHFK